jgi:hypothetical protein
MIDIGDRSRYRSRKVDRSGDTEDRSSDWLFMVGKLGEGEEPEEPG